MRAIKNQYYPHEKIEFWEHPLQWWDSWNFEPKSDAKQISRIVMSVVGVIVLGTVALMTAVYVIVWLAIWNWWIFLAGFVWLVYRWFRWTVKS